MPDIADKEVLSLIETFTKPQLFDLAHALPLQKQLHYAQNKPELIKELLKSADFNHIALAAHRMEALLPFKHAFILSLPDGIDFPQIVATIAKNGFSKITTKFMPGEINSEDLKPQVCIIDESTKRVYLKCVHGVYSEEWERVTPTQKRLRKYWRRHPVVLTLRTNEQLASISFPGFTQGSSTPYERRLDYTRIAKATSDLFKEHTGIEMAGISTKKAIDNLLNDEPETVFDIRRTIKTQSGGRFFVDTGETGGDVAEFFRNYMKQEAKLEISLPEANQLLKSGDAEDVLLLWKQIGFLTRFTFHDYTTEILFVWRGVSAATTIIDDVISKLARLRLREGKLFIEADNFVQTLEKGAFVRPSTLMQKFSLTEKETMEILTAALSRRALSIRYRVKTASPLKEISNEWRANLLEIPTEVTDESDKTISLLDPHNIEVAFERL